MRNEDAGKNSVNRVSSSTRLFLISTLSIIRECMASEISRRYPSLDFSFAATIDEIGQMNLGRDDVVLIDATHEEPGFDIEHLLSRLGGVRAIVLTESGLVDTLGQRPASRPATLAALMELVGAACGVSKSHCERDAPAGNAWRDLTPREREVASLLLEGKSNKEIANEIGLSDNTVKMHLAQIMRRLHVTNRTQVVLLLGGGRDAHPADQERIQREARGGAAGSHGHGGTANAPLLSSA